ARAHGRPRPRALRVGAGRQRALAAAHRHRQGEARRVGHGAQLEHGHEAGGPDRRVAGPHGSRILGYNEGVARMPWRRGPDGRRTRTLALAHTLALAALALLAAAPAPAA